DVPLALAQKSVIEAAGKLGRRGIAFLIKAAAHERSRVRINAIAGLARFGKTDPEPSLAFLTQVEASDSVPDVRSAAKQAMLAIVADEMIYALQDGRNHVRINGARALGVLGEQAARAARSIGLLMRDSVAS